MASFNMVVEVGNLTDAPELKQTQSGLSVCSFTLAVNRRFKEADGTRGCDFINCVAWRQTAEFLAGQAAKGTTVLVRGSLQNRQYKTKQGESRTATEVVADEVVVLRGKEIHAPVEEATEAPREQMAFTPGDVKYQEINADDDLPF